MGTRSFDKRLIAWSAALAVGCAGGVSAPSPVPAGCSGYPPQATSLYRLPYTIGAEFRVGQGNCTTRSHATGSPDEYAYDFLMPIGTPVAASRSGIVQQIEERYVDGNRTQGQENFVFIRHDDGTFGTYWHLTQNGALVGVGDVVPIGHVIGLSGDTGFSSEPHLHFAVVIGGRTRPVTFRNTRPHPNGLAEGETYLALAPGDGGH